MPQLNTAIYYHEYSWLFFTFFCFYFMFLKYLLPSLIRWMKTETNSLIYHLNLVDQLDKLIEDSNSRVINNSLYKLLLTITLLQQLPQIYNNNLTADVKTSSSERTIFTLLTKYSR